MTIMSDVPTAKLRLASTRRSTIGSVDLNSQMTNEIIAVSDSIINQEMNDDANHSSSCHLSSTTNGSMMLTGSSPIPLNTTGAGFATASKNFKHVATSKSRSNTDSNSTKHKSPHLSGWRQIISLIT